MPNQSKDETQNLNKSETPGSHRNPQLVELHRQISRAEPWSSRFQHLVETIGRLDDSEKISPTVQGQMNKKQILDCELCEEMIDRYVEDDLAGHDVQQKYPMISQHLQTCDNCWETYELLADVLAQEQQKAFSPVEGVELPALSFLQSQPNSAPWVIRVRPQIAGDEFGLQIILNVFYLKKLFFGQDFATVRAEEPFSIRKTFLLFSDIIRIGERSLLVEMTATRLPKQPDDLALSANITSSDIFYENLWAKLNWAGQTYIAPVDDSGQVNLGRISLKELQAFLNAEESSFELSIEVEE